jgi:beta-galactosidase
LKGLKVVTVSPQVVQVTTRHKVKLGRAPLETCYTVYGSGDVVVESSFTPRKNMPRFGVKTEVPGRYDRVTWFGCGPHENYVDRKDGAAVGVYSVPAEEMIHDYLAPQENGHRTGVRWVTLTDAGGKGLMLADTAGTLLGMNVWPYTLEDLDEATRIHELPRRENLTLCIDYRQRGVGSFIVNMMRKDPTLQENRRYAYGFRLRPYDAQDGPPVRDKAWSEPAPPPEPVAEEELTQEKKRRVAVNVVCVAAVVAAIAWLLLRWLAGKGDADADASPSLE